MVSKGKMKTELKIQIQMAGTPESTKKFKINDDFVFYFFDSHTTLQIFQNQMARMDTVSVLPCSNDVYFATDEL